jgi:membrane protease YdiL (CAAX protease family)
MSSRKPGAVPVYVLAVFLLSAPFYALSATGGGSAWIDYIGCLMWCPAAAAFLTCRYLGRSVAGIAWRWGDTHYEITSYLIPLCYATVIYVCAWTAGVGKFYNKPFVDLFSKEFGFGPLPAWAAIGWYFCFTATIAVIKDLATVLGEEIGWRGFLVPELAKKYSFARTALISGAVWALWHYPLLLFGSYHPPTPIWFYLPTFTVTVITINFLWTWMRLKSGSIWPCVVLHAAHNTFIQRFFDPLTIAGRSTWYVTGEFGSALMLVSMGIAVYLWKRSPGDFSPARTAPSRSAVEVL